MMKPERTFPTRSDAETYIAQRNLAGKKKPQHVVSRWYLVTNREGTINRSLFTEILRVEYRRLARREHWPASYLSRKLQNVPADAERIWRELRAKKGKRK